MAKYLNVMFTMSDPKDLPQLEEDVGYMVYQEEISTKTSLYHLQGYIEFTKQKSMKQVKEFLQDPSVHLDRRKGTQQDAITYCTKERTRIADGGPYIFGTPKETTPGKRNDLVAYKEAIEAGARERELYEEGFIRTSVQHRHLYAKIDSFKRPIREKAPEVYLLIGDTGLGKTRYVSDRYLEDPEFWISPLSNGTTWFDGYDHHKIVLLDDFAGAASHITLSSLLRLLDRLALYIPNKGAHTWWHPEKIYLTSNILPKYWYSWEKRINQYAALGRRFTKVLLFRTAGPVEADVFWWAKNAPEVLGA